jgi:hypothetical protein
MMIRRLLFMSAFALSIQANAQSWVEDSVTMGPGYTNDVFYSMKNGSQKVEPNTNWHLAFQMTPPGPYGNVSILANHVQGGVNVYPLHMSAAMNFTTLSAADTIGKTSATMALYNADSNWNYGAFNRMNDVTNLYDYSWGLYNPTTHHVVGDSMYLVKITAGPNTTAYKLWVKQYTSTPADSVNWEFRIAKFDGTEDTTVKIYRKPAYVDRLFAYYNMATKTVLDREPGRYTWDVLFTRYKEYLAGAPGVPYYSVMGLLSNFDVTVADVRHIAMDDTAGYQAFAYSKKLNEIGSDWKVFDMSQNPPAYVIDDSTYFFVKTKNTQEYYQLKFTAFGGGANGKVVFKKRLLGAIPNSITTINTPLAVYHLAPNPASSSVSILLDSKEQVNNARVLVTDLMGKVAYSRSVNITNGLNAYELNIGNLAAGTYLVTLSNGSWKATEKLIVQH